MALRCVTAIGLSVGCGLDWRGVKPSVERLCDTPGAVIEPNIPMWKLYVVEMASAALLANPMRPTTPSGCAVSKLEHGDLH